jgi:hypothetical protein
MCGLAACASDLTEKSNARQADETTRRETKMFTLERKDTCMRNLTFKALPLTKNFINYHRNALRREDEGSNDLVEM